MKKVVVIGGGASGMMASLIASRNGKSVTLIEKNEKLGKKIYITGKGRCNLSNFVEPNEFLNNVVSNPKFVYGSIYTFSPKDTYDFFENLGLKLKTERGNRVFPFSDKASDVTKYLQESLLKQGVNIRLNTCVDEILTDNGHISGVKVLSNGQTELIDCDSVIVCTGGISYPSTGSTGDGYLFAKKQGHSVVPTRPSLVGIDLKGNDFAKMQGLSLKNVSISCFLGEKLLYSDFGEMLFTHFGVSGPIILSCSAVINKHVSNDLTLIIDLKPALTNEVLDQRLVRDFLQNNNKSLGVYMRELLPKSMIEIILSRAKISFEKKCCEITKVERDNLINVLKNFTFKIRGLRPIEEAIVTAGGVSTKEINPKTMESKLCKGLFFAGEVIDIDAFTGGFNLQLAFSTGFVAGNNA